MPKAFMPKPGKTKWVESDLREHPAMLAWQTLLPSTPPPESIGILWEVKKSAIYRLHGVGRVREVRWS